MFLRLTVYLETTPVLDVVANGRSLTRCARRGNRARYATCARSPARVLAASTAAVSEAMS
jgi:hypothetical protein